MDPEAGSGRALPHRTRPETRLMCGIAGFVAAIGSEQAQSVAMKMARTLRHRGPDRQDAEVLTLSNHRVLGLSHALLSIIGKPGEGTQPFHVDGGILLF